VPRKVPGFSLIEMAIVLIIIGLVAGMTLPTLRGMVDWQKGRVTANHQEQILYALASFAIQNKSLPYAADPLIPLGLNTFGKEDKDNKQRRGIVPFASLGLPKAIACDGYQRWFTYVVDEHYAIMPKVEMQGGHAHTLENRLCEKRSPANPLKLKGNGLETNIAFAIISHGPQGRGAYPNPLEKPPLGPDEHTNATSDRQIIDRPLSQDPSNPFSHLVVWVTPRNLLAIYGHSPCPREKEMVPSSLPIQFPQSQPKFEQAQEEKGKK
jgi:prepilin-type N-terminal cleavage/methylation domain-containing protein